MNEKPGETPSQHCEMYIETLGVASCAKLVQLVALESL